MWKICTDQPKNKVLHIKIHSFAPLHAHVRMLFVHLSHYYYYCYILYITNANLHLRKLNTIGSSLRTQQYWIKETKITTTKRAATEEEHQIAFTASRAYEPKPNNRQNQDQGTHQTEMVARMRTETKTVATIIYTTRVNIIVFFSLFFCFCFWSHAIWVWDSGAHRQFWFLKLCIIACCFAIAGRSGCRLTEGNWIAYVINGNKKF